LKAVALNKTSAVRLCKS